MNNNKRYKVVTENHIVDTEEVKFFKSVNLGADNDFCLNYEIEKITWSTIGTMGIFIFDNLENAIRFGNSFLTRSKIFILEGVSYFEKEPNVIARAEFYYYKLAKIIYSEKNPKILLNCPEFYTFPPIGTLCCSGFKPERINRFKNSAFSIFWQ